MKTNKSYFRPSTNSKKGGSIRVVNKGFYILINLPKWTYEKIQNFSIWYPFLIII